MDLRIVLPRSRATHRNPFHSMLQGVDNTHLDLAPASETREYGDQHQHHLRRCRRQTPARKVHRLQGEEMNGASSLLIVNGYSNLWRIQYLSARLWSRRRQRRVH